MIRIQRILVPTDFSPCASQALDRALNLANEYGATLHILHAVVLHEDDPHNPAAHFLDIGDIQQRLIDLARTEMQASIRERTDVCGNVVFRQWRGFSATDVILEYSGEESIDLIVMGTHGRRGLGNMFLGSVAERVVRHAPCPVLTLREREDMHDKRIFSRILVPVDFSEHARNAMSHAREIAATHGATLEVLHVIDEVPRPEFYENRSVSLDLSPSDLMERAEKEMVRLFASSTGPDVEVRYHTAVGRAGDGIVDCAAQLGVDLIVIGTHGLSGIRHLLLGSVAERVVRVAPCPVLTLKSFERRLLDGSTTHRTAEEVTRRVLRSRA